ncbi:MAG: ribosome biogenesis GTPase YlqF [Erysipelotrichaceae bacterium]|nr:ribosome biogenesis GTPase YlqF [Erysipelotrichaceae bacterium]
MTDKNINNQANVNWFPGHMAKAIREIKEKLNLVDMVIEICDARAPFSSSNPLVKELVNNKFYFKVLSKIDLADDAKTQEYKSKLEDNNIPCCLVNLNNKDSIKPLVNKIKEVAKPMVEKDLKRGLKPRNVRVMVIGIPNVGKSTLINLLAKRKSAGVGNIPGFTRAQKWVHCDSFDLLDTPGILWPNLKENNAGIKLSLIGCIKSDVLPVLDLAHIAINFLNKHYKDLLFAKYGIQYKDDESYLIDLSIKMGHLLKNGEIDNIRCATFLLNEIKNGKIGKVSVENLEV